MEWGEQNGWRILLERAPDRPKNEVADAVSAMRKVSGKSVGSYSTFNHRKGFQPDYDIHEILLFFHNHIDVLIGACRFFEVLPAAEGMENPLVVEDLFFPLQIEGLDGRPSSHFTAGAVGAAHETLGVSLSSYNIAGRSLGAGDDAHLSITCRCCAFANFQYTRGRFLL